MNRVRIGTRGSPLEAGFAPAARIPPSIEVVRTGLGNLPMIVHSMEVCV